MTDSFVPTSFSCFLDEKGKCVFSDNEAFFRRLLSGKKFKTDFAAAAQNHSRSEKNYTFDGIKYKVIIIPVAGEKFYVVAYPEDCYIKFSYSEMYMRLFNIRINANNIKGTLQLLKDNLHSDQDIGARITRLIDELEHYSGEVLINADDVLSLFDIEHIGRYVNLSEKLHHTEYCIKPYNARYDRTVNFRIDIEHLVAKVNYTVLEAAVYGIAGIMYKTLPVGGKGTVSFTEIENGHLLLEAQADVSEVFKRNTIDNDIRNVRCAIDALGGTSETVGNKDAVIIKARIPVKLSNYVHRINTGAYDKDDEYEKMSGYHLVIAPDELSGEEMSPEAELILNSFRSEYKRDYSAILAEIMLGTLY